MSERGGALVISLLVLVCLSGLGLGLVAAGDAERSIAANARRAAETMRAAEAAAEGVLPEIAAASSWTTLLATSVSAFHEATRKPVVPSRATVDLDVITAELQSDASAVYPLGPNTPVWRLYAWGPLTTMAGLAREEAGTYVAVWLADDPSDGDDLAGADANGIIMVHSEAFGFGRTRRSVDAVVARTAGGVRVLSWRTH